ncbi:MAG: aldolase, partial [Candidatus Margulisiibacteriota bacterium]
MNDLELKMVDILKELKDKYGAVGVRAEFEAEGTKLEELLRLKEISMKAGVSLVLKIGGCESVRDMLEARVVGVDSLVAPMV